MSTSPWSPTAGAAAAPASPTEGAAADGATTLAAASAAATPEQHQEGGDAAASAATLQQRQEEEEAKPQLLREDDLEAEVQEHEQKINKYQAILAACLKAKYFSNKSFDGGNVFEAETIIDGETIQSSRWPCTSSFANPINLFREKNNHEMSGSPSLTADSSAKNNSPRTGSSPKNSASALSTENNLTPGKRQPSKKT
ncbi:hypothetical protein GUJ93_ZPchr0002g26530 [Zizania palustris]|uniref:Uncharacterized protein n=1 Tax=Zizania palustris TaxID=103762 RepID=A0A8J5VA53_ZIZPA|nr:hypothetical protein GUJ93_ZPchr0002g26530 [Zizania palustris]